MRSPQKSCPGRRAGLRLGKVARDREHCHPRGMQSLKQEAWGGSQGLVAGAGLLFAATACLDMKVEESRLSTQRYLLHGGWLGVSYLPGWSYTPCPWPQLDDVLGPEYPPGHVQMSLSGHLGQATCSITQATAHALYCKWVVHHHHIAAAQGLISRAVRDRQISQFSPLCFGLSPEFIRNLGDLHRLLF